MICTDYNHPEIRHDVKILSVVTDNRYTGYDEVINKVNWRIVSYHEDYPDLKMPQAGTMSLGFEPDESTSFTPFDEITESTLVEWIYNGYSHISIIASQNANNVMNELFPTESRKTYTYMGN